MHRLLLYIALFSTLTSCSSTTITSDDNEHYSLITTGSDKQLAQANAKSKAIEKCEAEGKSVRLFKQRMKYNGTDENYGAVDSVASMALGKYNPSSSSEDYEVTMNFACA